MFGRHVQTLKLAGSMGIALAVAYMSVGLFLHFHFFWSSHPTFHPVGRAGKVLSAATFVACLGYVVCRLAVSGW